MRNIGLLLLLCLQANILKKKTEFD